MSDKIFLPVLDKLVARRESEGSCRLLYVDMEVGSRIIDASGSRGTVCFVGNVSGTKG